MNEKKANNLLWLSFAGYVFFFALAYWVSLWFFVPAGLCAVAGLVFLIAGLAIHFFQLGRGGER